MMKMDISMTAIFSLNYVTFKQIGGGSDVCCYIQKSATQQNNILKRRKGVVTHSQPHSYLNDDLISAIPIDSIQIKVKFMRREVRAGE